MKILSEIAINTAIGNGRESRITWIEFKNMMELRGLTYDTETKRFYYIMSGRRQEMDRMVVLMQAGYAGLYDDLRDYVSSAPAEET